jgi:hypothetical protein
MSMVDTLTKAALVVVFYLILSVIRIQLGF